MRYFFLHLPIYALKNNLNLNKEELSELDFIAELMLEPDNNFDKLRDIWNKNDKFKQTGGVFN